MPEIRRRQLNGSGLLLVIEPSNVIAAEQPQFGTDIEQTEALGFAQKGVRNRAGKPSGAGHA